MISCRLVVAQINEAIDALGGLPNVRLENTESKSLWKLVSELMLLDLVENLLLVAEVERYDVGLVLQGKDTVLGLQQLSVVLVQILQIIHVSEGSELRAYRFSFLQQQALEKRLLRVVPVLQSALVDVPNLQAQP